ncbi:MAG: M48 family metallopeptidase [Deltaproteobacteria bacterium]|nr:M48 family metallopeptidase [Deltaproteobacteria bacterium]
MKPGRTEGKIVIMTSPAQPGSQARQSPSKIRLYIAAALAAGFCLTVLASLAGLVLGLISDFRYQGYPGLLSFAWLTGVLLSLRGILFFTLRRPAIGQPIRPEDQPDLFKLVNEVADKIGSRPVDRLLIVPDANVKISIGCCFPFISRNKDLLIGMALLDRLSVGNFRASLACILARCSNDQSRLSDWICLTSNCLEEIITKSERTVFTIVFELYARWFIKLAQPFSSAQKMGADQQAAQIVGKEVYFESLVQVAWTSHQMSAFIGREILPLLAAGGLPDNIFAGLRIWLKSQEVNDLNEHKPEKLFEMLPIPPLGRMGLAERLALVRKMDQGADWGDQTSLASVISDKSALEKDATKHVLGVLRRHGIGKAKDRPKLLSWEDIEGCLIIPQQKARAEHTLKTLAQIVRRDIEVQEGINIYLSLIDVPEYRVRLAGRLDPNLTKLPTALYPELVLGILTRFLGSLVGNALVKTGTYKWVKPVAMPLNLVGDEGERLDPFSLAKDLLEGELDVGRFRMTLFEHGLFVAK